MSKRPTVRRQLVAALMLLSGYLAGCGAIGEKYIPGDPFYERIRAQKYPKCPMVQYPTYSHVNEEQGVVQVEVQVAEDGSVSGTKMHKGTGFLALDAATIEHVKTCKFEPRSVNGKPISYRTIFSMHWELWM
jgi:TonB family protein